MAEASARYCLTNSLRFGAVGHGLAGPFVEALALVVVEDGFADDAPGGCGAEVLFAVESLDPIDEFAAVEAGRVGVLGEAAGHIESGALLDVLEDLLVA